jgi:hypothetical protein
MKIKVTKEAKAKIPSVIDSINALESVRDYIKSELLSKDISEDKVESILNKEETIDILNAKEKFRFLKVMFNYSRGDETLNPKKMIVDDNTDTKVSTKKGTKSKKSTSATDNEEDKPKYHEIPELYYDYEFKLEYANEFPAETKRVIMSLFRKSRVMEEKLGKDLCNFNIKELTEFFKSLHATTIRSLQNSTSTVERYVDWAQRPENRDGKTSLKVNYATAFDTKDKLEKLIDKEKEHSMIIPKAELLDRAMSADNPQDGVIIALLTDGVSHKNEFEELIELTIDDVDRTNGVINFPDRKVPISHETSILIRDAYRQEKYISFSEDGESSRKYKIADGINILRGLRGKAKVKAQIIHQRLMRLRDNYSNKEDNQYFNATTISYSGQVHRVNELIEEGNSIDKAVEQTLVQFAIPVNETSKFYLKERVEKYNEVLKSRYAN